MGSYNKHKSLGTVGITVSQLKMHADNFLFKLKYFKNIKEFTEDIWTVRFSVLYIRE